MEKPPFQCGLKAVFLATTGAAILMAVVVTFPEFAAWLAVAFMLSLAVFIAFAACIIGIWLALYIVGYLIIRLFDSLNKPADDSLAPLPRPKD